MTTSSVAAITSVQPATATVPSGSALSPTHKKIISSNLMLVTQKENEKDVQSVYSSPILKHTFTTTSEATVSATHKKITHNTASNSLMVAASSDTVPLDLNLFEEGPGVDGPTPLMNAAEEGNYEECELLLKEGADPLKINTNNQRNALHYAVIKGSVPIVTMLLSYKELIDSEAEDKTPLMLAVENDKAKICDQLLKAGANVFATDRGGWNVMHYAAFFGKTEIISKFSSHKQLLTSTTIRGHTPLSLAAYQGYSETCRCLLHMGANPLLACLKDGLAFFAFAAFDFDKDIDTDGWNAMHYAVHNGKIEVVKIFSQNKELVLSKTKKGQTPLILAAKEKHLEVCELLLQSAADPFAADEDGNTAMHFALKSRDIKVVRLLAVHKQLINLPNNDDDFPLHLAINLGYVELCALLLQAGADPHLKGKRRQVNAFYHADWGGQKEIVDLLEKHSQRSPKSGKSGITFGSSFEDELQVSTAASDLKEMANTDDARLSSLSKNSPHTTSSSPQNSTLMAVISNDTIQLSPIDHSRFLLKQRIFMVTPTASPVGIATVQQPANTPTHLSGQTLSATDTKIYSSNLMSQAQNVSERHVKTMESSSRSIGLKKKSTEESDDDEKPMSEFQRAVHEGNVEAVRQNLARDKKLANGKNSQDNTPLQDAASEGHLKVCELLLEAGADPFEADEDGMNAMHWAAYHGKVEIVRLFSTNKKLVNSKDNEGRAPFMQAVAQGHIDVCQVLLEAGADPYSRDVYESTAMHVAVESSEYAIDMIKLLLKFRQLVNAKDMNGTTPLMIAARNGALGICEMLLKAGADSQAIDNKGWTAVRHAEAYQKIEIVAFLSSDKKSAVSPLLLAAEIGDNQKFEQLLKEGANPLEKNKENSNAMHLAILAGQIEIVRLLLQYQALIDAKNKEGYTPLILAAKEGRHEICEALLKSGADPLAKDKNGQNALHWAARINKIEVVRRLSNNKQLVCAKDINGCTPFMFSVDNFEMYEILLAAGENLLETDNEGRNILHHASVQGKTKIVQSILSSKELTRATLIHSKTKKAETPLMFAADEGHPEICEMLLKAGADAFATDNNGMTALRRAENQDHPSFGRALVIEALKKHMACNDAQQNKDNKRCGRFGCTIA